MNFYVGWYKRRNSCTRFQRKKCHRKKKKKCEMIFRNEEWEGGVREKRRVRGGGRREREERLRATDGGGECKVSQEQ